MSYPSELTDEQWAMIDFSAPGRRGRKHADDLRSVLDAILYIARTGCHWRYLPESFGPWTRVWSQLRRWSRNGTRARALAVLHAAAPPATLALLHEVSPRVTGHGRAGGSMFGVDGSQPCLQPGRFNELDRIPGWVFEQDLLSAYSDHDVVAEIGAVVAQCLDRGVEIVDVELEPIPASRRLSLPARHVLPATWAPAGRAEHGAKSPRESIATAGAGCICI
jgi:transposase